MNMKYTKKYFSLGLLLAGNIFFAMSHGQFPHTSFVPMTCGQNLYSQYHKPLFFDDSNDDGCLLADLSATYRYVQNRKNDSVSAYLWGSSQLLFQGSEIPNRKSNALIAEYFGMGPDTDITVSMNPQLKNQIVDLQLQLSGEQLWFQINVPLTWARWRPQKGCPGFQYSGTMGTKKLDGGQVTLRYGWDGGAVNANGIAAIRVNDTILTNTTVGGNAGCVWFDNNQNVSADSSIIGQIMQQDALPPSSVDNVQLGVIDGLTTRTTVLADGGALSRVEFYNQSMQLGIIPVGLYGEAASNATTKKTAVLNLETVVEEVPAVGPESVAESLGQGYSFGKFRGRKNNNFNFLSCTKFNVADLPMMLGYDFCKSDAYHFGLYIKCVIPTGTKIDANFLQFVLTPVIGNGRHFELGAGLSGHLNFSVSDESAWGVFVDGYATKMFNTWQNRVFDLIGQPLSRYALAYAVDGFASTGYSVRSAEMVSIGDINIYQGNVTASRGEFMIDCIYSCGNWEAGVGYAFAGQTAEKICSPCGNNVTQHTKYGIVGQASQDLIGIGVLYPQNANSENGFLNNNYTYTPATPNTPAVANIQVNLFDLGKSNQVALLGENESAAFNYGSVVEANNDSIIEIDNFIGQCNGLMGSQILNKIFGHFDYVWKDCAWQPEIGVLGSVGFAPCTKMTAQYWDVGARVGVAF
jgi:hypothetical protein